MSLMLINPRKRSAKKRRSPAQRAATARLVAHNKGRKSNPRKRRAVHAKRRHNPIGLSRVHHRAKHRARRRNPSARAMLGMGGIGGLVMNGLKGAVGAVAVNAVTNFLPAQVRTGKALYATRAVIAIVIGTAGRKVLGANARTFAEGALTVNFADLINSMAGNVLPGSQLHGVGGEYMGEFLSGTHVPQGLPYASQSFRPVNDHLDRELHGVGEYMY